MSEIREIRSNVENFIYEALKKQMDKYL